MTTPIDQLAALGSPATRVDGVVRDADDRAFARTLDRAQQQGVTDEEARQTAQQLVATTFIAPVLRQVRESNTAPPPWGPTSVEKNFGPMLDTQLADRIVAGARLPIVDRIALAIASNAGQTPARADSTGVTHG